jgi:hypothetical protein
MKLAWFIPYIVAEVKRSGSLYETSFRVLARYRTTPLVEATEELCLSSKSKGLTLAVDKLTGRRAAV